MKKGNQTRTNAQIEEVPSRIELEQQLRERAWEDEAFRQEFLSNPKAVLKRDYAQWFPDGEFPPNVNIKIAEEDDHTICFTLPRKVPNYSFEGRDLSTEELDAIAGGSKCTNTGACSWAACTDACSQTRCPRCHSFRGTILKKL